MERPDCFTFLIFDIFDGTLNPMPKQQSLFQNKTASLVKEFAKVKSEHDLRVKVKEAFFGDYSVDVEDERIDFLVYHERGGFFAETLMWAEAKDKPTDTFEMFAQLLLTIKKKYDAGEMPPKYLGVFDKEKIAFTEFNNTLDIFRLNDFDWSERPSSVSKKTVNQVTRYLKNIIEYRFENHVAEIVEFIRTNFALGKIGTTKAQINKNNFVTVYNKWMREVLPTIALSSKDWKDLKKNGVGDCDFYLADLLSRNNMTIVDKLKIVLKLTYYESKIRVADRLKTYYEKIDFRDKGVAHDKFWTKYERPPKQEYHKHIIERRDLLVPQDIRERKGAFFTPQIWVEKSQEYLAQVFGENWQDEYYIWDCCAGTCNLLVGLTNQYNVWASTIDQPDVDIVHEIIDNHGLNLLKSHVFQFDFLNDDFSKLPKGLRDIINDPEKRKRVIIYMNPPYAEGGSSRQMSGTGKYKTGIEKNKTHDKYHSLLAGANREKFAQFLMRIYYEIPDCKIAHFGTLKSLAGPHFKTFRSNFRAKLKSLLICPANTFDNVNGQFAIGFFVWDAEVKQIFKKINADAYDHKGNYIGVKSVSSYGNIVLFSKWVNSFKLQTGLRLGWLEGTTRNDFQHNGIIFILNDKEQMVISRGMTIFDKNLIDCCVCYAVRKCIPSNWLNNRDQFLYPDDTYKTDKEFQNDCLMFTLFHDKNQIRRYDGINHWIPFAEREVDAKDNFQSTFMNDFLKKRKKMSKEAKNVFNAGKTLWRYYHETIENDDDASIDATLYEIREYFKGRDVKGRMKMKATDERFNELDAELRAALKKLAKKIELKVYEHGFLKK